MQRVHSAPGTIRLAGHGEHSYVEMVIISSEESPETNSTEERAPFQPPENSPHCPVVSPPALPQGTLSPSEQGVARPEPVGGIHSIISGIVSWCSEKAQRLLSFLQTRVQDIRPVGSNTSSSSSSRSSFRSSSRSSSTFRSSSSSRSNSSSTRSSSSSSSNQESAPIISGEASKVEEEAGASQTGPKGNPSCLQPVPDPAEQEQPQKELEQSQEEPEQPVGAGLCVQGSSCSPSAPTGGRNCSPGGSQHPRKRMVSSPQDCAPPSKRLSRQ
ncbi:hypothetical protein WISP_00229 [Willisornis vidua]|uniref:Uncharacterized protein n=1 Tax=Willisornis vidua TaxID=1566151 RepID=A0ABQ9CP14_9PASS|nr:hypothetical protein WISP_00229 [Willisornis vidua]